MTLKVNPIDERFKVDELLKALPFVKELRESGSDIMFELSFDIERAINEAELTNEEHVILDYYFVQGYTLKDVEVLTGINYRTVARRIKRIKEKIRDVLERWTILDEQDN